MRFHFERGELMTAEPTYFAVPDPDNPATITYWRTNRRGEFVPWPAKARYGPRVDRSAVPDGSCYDRERMAAIERLFAPIREWHAKIVLAIAEDPEGCQARFARFSSRCCCCGRVLTDPASKTYGIGPECRGGLPDELLARMAEAMGRVHGEWLQSQEAATA